MSHDVEMIIITPDGQEYEVREGAEMDPDAYYEMVEKFAARADEDLGPVREDDDFSGTYLWSGFESDEEFEVRRTIYEGGVGQWYELDYLEYGNEELTARDLRGFIHAGRLKRVQG